MRPGAESSQLRVTLSLAGSHNQGRSKQDILDVGERVTPELYANGPCATRVILLLTLTLEPHHHLNLTRPPLPHLALIFLAWMSLKRIAIPCMSLT